MSRGESLPVSDREPPEGAFVEVVEVGPRDGLQAQGVVLDVRERIQLIEMLVSAGARRIEVASFVHPGRVPQMAGAEEVVSGLRASANCSYIGLVLNRRGLDRALMTAVDEVNFVVAAAEGYSRANQEAPITETMAEIESMVPLAAADGRRTSITVSVAFGCPYDGEVAPGVVADLAQRAVAAGVDEVAVGDTIGAAVPADVRSVIAAVAAAVGRVPIRCHFHNTRHTAMANVQAAIDSGVRVLDASVGGIGGSPFAPGAGGNVATEDLLWMLDRSQLGHGMKLGAVMDVAAWLAERLGYPLPGALAEAGIFPPVSH